MVKIPNSEFLPIPVSFPEVKNDFQKQDLRSHFLLWFQQDRKFWRPLIVLRIFFNGDIKCQPKLWIPPNCGTDVRISFSIETIRLARADLEEKIKQLDDRMSHRFMTLEIIDSFEERGEDDHITLDMVHECITLQ